MKLKSPGSCLNTYVCGSAASIYECVCYYTLIFMCMCHESSVSIHVQPRHQITYYHISNRLFKMIHTGLEKPLFNVSPSTFKTNICHDQIYIVGRLIGDCFLAFCSTEWSCFRKANEVVGLIRNRAVL